MPRHPSSEPSLRASSSASSYASNDGEDASSKLRYDLDDETKPSTESKQLDGHATHFTAESRADIASDEHAIGQLAAASQFTAHVPQLAIKEPAHWVQTLFPPAFSLADILSLRAGDTTAAQAVPHARLQRQHCEVGDGEHISFPTYPSQPAFTSNNYDSADRKYMTAHQPPFTPVEPPLSRDRDACCSQPTTELFDESQFVQIETVSPKWNTDDQPTSSFNQREAELEVLVRRACRGLLQELQESQAASRVLIAELAERDRCIADRDAQLLKLELRNEQLSRQLYSSQAELRHLTNIQLDMKQSLLSAKDMQDRHARLQQTCRDLVTRLEQVSSELTAVKMAGQRHPLSRNQAAQRQDIVHGQDFVVNASTGTDNEQHDIVTASQPPFAPLSASVAPSLGLVRHLEALKATEQQSNSLPVRVLRLDKMRFS